MAKMNPFGGTAKDFNDIFAAAKKAGKKGIATPMGEIGRPLALVTRDILTKEGNTGTSTVPAEGELASFEGIGGTNAKAEQNADFAVTGSAAAGDAGKRSRLAGTEFVGRPSGTSLTYRLAHGSSKEVEPGQPIPTRGPLPVVSHGERVITDVPLVNAVDVNQRPTKETFMVGGRTVTLNPKDRDVIATERDAERAGADTTVRTSGTMQGTTDAKDSLSRPGDKNSKFGQTAIRVQGRAVWDYDAEGKRVRRDVVEPVGGTSNPTASSAGRNKQQVKTDWKKVPSRINYPPVPKPDLAWVITKNYAKALVESFLTDALDMVEDRRVPHPYPGQGPQGRREVPSKPASSQLLADPVKDAVLKTMKDSLPVTVKNKTSFISAENLTDIVTASRIHHAASSAEHKGTGMLAQGMGARTPGSSENITLLPIKKTTAGVIARNAEETIAKSSKPSTVTTGTTVINTEPTKQALEKAQTLAGRGLAPGVAAQKAKAAVYRGPSRDVFGTVPGLPKPSDKALSDVHKARNSEMFAPLADFAEQLRKLSVAKAAGHKPGSEGVNWDLDNPEIVSKNKTRLLQGVAAARTKWDKERNAPIAPAKP